MILGRVQDTVRHLFSFSDKNAKAAIVSDLETYGTGIEPEITMDKFCLLYTSPSPRDRQKSRMPSSA